MNAKIVLSRLADRDLEKIWATTAVHDPRAADRVIHMITDRLRQLADYPLSGAPRDDIGAGLRQLLVDNYLVIYRARPGTQVVRVNRILHARRRLTPARDDKPGGTG